MFMLFSILLDANAEEVKKLVSGPLLYPHWQGSTLKVVAPGGKQAQLQIANMGDKAPLHWLVKIQATPFRLLLQMRLAIASRLQRVRLFIYLYYGVH